MLPLPESDRLVVVLVRPRNPLNIGAVARAISNFGFQSLRVVKPFDAAFREARSAVGAKSVLAGAKQYDDVPSAVADCTLVVGTTAGRSRNLQQPYRLLDGRSAGIVRRRLRSGSVAMLFGSEKTGLTNDELDHCHWLLRVPTRAAHVSMNLGQAAAVCLYELANASAPLHGVKAAPTATAAQAERITRDLFQILRRCEYVKRGSEDSVEQNLRRFVRRLHLDADDSELWLGMLRQIGWKLQQSE